MEVAQLWGNEHSSLAVCGFQLAEQGKPFSDKDKVALHEKTNKHELSVSISFLHIGLLRLLKEKTGAWCAVRCPGLRV